MPSTSTSIPPRSPTGSTPAASRTRPSRRSPASSAGRSPWRRSGGRPATRSRKCSTYPSRSSRPRTATVSGANPSMQTSKPVADRPRRPAWMKVRAPSANSRYYDVKKLIHGASLHTICEEARCPNIGECWGRGTATFQILGDTCTRACRYCYVTSGKPDSPPDLLEPLRLANVAAQMELQHVVVTSVDRDERRGGGDYARSPSPRRRRGHDRPVSAAEREAREDRPLGPSRRVPLVPRAGRDAGIRLRVLRPARAVVVPCRRAAARSARLLGGVDEKG